MPNPSELARREGELSDAVARVNNLKLPKESREQALREVRVLEKELGVEAFGNMNSAQDQQDEALVASQPGVVTLQDLKDAREHLFNLTPGEVGTIIIALGEAPGPQAKALIKKILNR